MSDIDPESLAQALGLLGRLMLVRRRPPIHLVICGGSALIARRACTKTGRGPAARDSGGGPGGEAGASPEWAVRAEPTPAAVQKNRRPEGFRGNGPATALLVGHRPPRVCSLLAPCPQAVSTKTGPLPVLVQALGLVTRTTQDVDVLATLDDGQLHCARPLPEWLLADAEAVRSEVGLPMHWLNDGPADEDLFRLGLPVGVTERLSGRDFGAALQVSFISRHDQIHFKLYAAADQGGRHFTDLRQLKPSPEELLAAARWTFTQDASDAFRQVVVEVFQALGHGELHERI